MVCPEISFSSRELIELILKEKSIHKGHWMLLVHFGFTAMNVGQGESGEDAMPAGVVSVQKVGIKKIPQPVPFSVNAAAVNPLVKKASKKPAVTK